MFQTFKTIDTAVRQLRSVSKLVVLGSVLLSLYAIYYGYNQAWKIQDRIYILAGDKALEAVAADRKDNLAVEAKDHIRNFHQLFFTLEPDEKVITANIGRALYLGDGSVKRLYDNIQEAGYFSRIISGNISQSVAVDSIRLDMSAYPYPFTCWASQTLVRTSTVTTRNLVTTGWLRNTDRSDNNTHGFLIERFSVLDNHDLKTKNR
jgi:conjugative transposon TraK protein